MNELRLNEAFAFNRQCGIVKIADDEGEEWYVVYCETLFEESDSHQLGYAFGRGKTPFEAMQMAIMKLTEKLFLLGRKLEKIKSDIEDCENFVSDLDDSPAFPVLSWESRRCENGEYEYITTEKLVNPSIVMCSDGILGFCV